MQYKASLGVGVGQEDILSPNLSWHPLHPWHMCCACLQVCAKYKVSLFYTAPTAIRTLMSSGDDFVTRHDRSTLRVLGSVGEPINPEAWRWYYEVRGGGTAGCWGCFGGTACLRMRHVVMV